MTGRRGWTGPPFDGRFSLNYASRQAHGLVAWWPPLASKGIPQLFDLARQHTGTFGTTVVTRVQDGQMGAAVRLGGSYPDQGVITVAHRLDLSISGPMTVTAWANLTTYNANNAILFKGGVNVSNYFLWVQGDGRNPRFDIQGLTPTFLTDDTTTIALARWYHYAGVYDGASYRIYVDGVQTKTEAVTAGTPTANTTDIQFGLEPGGGGRWPWKGDIGDVRIYNRALSAPEVRELYAPQTRWELYAPMRRVWALSATGGSLLLLPAEMHGHTLRHGGKQ